MSRAAADTTTWLIAGVGTITTPLSTMETLTALYVAVTVLYLAATVGIFLLTRRALKMNQEVADRQVRSAFEATFFQMLNLHHENVRRLWMQTASGVPNEGRELLKEFAGQLKSSLESIRGDMRKRLNGVEPEERVVVESVGQRFFDVRQMWLGHYFHTVYHVLVHVDKHTEVDRVWFTKVLRAQLSTPELLLLFYFGLRPGKKMKALIERYGLLEDLPDDQLVRPEHGAFYKGSAYEAPRAVPPEVSGVATEEVEETELTR